MRLTGRCRPAVVIADPPWPAITAAAKITLSVLQGEAHGIRPQIVDEL